MKKSNKLLLVGFLTVILLITAINITIYAKYKNGDYTIYNAEDYLKPPSMESFPNIKFISIRNVQGATIRFGDVAQVEKENENRVQYALYGDTLLITGRGRSNQLVVRERVAFTLPYNATLSVFNSDVSFKTDKKSAEINTAIYLQKSAALFSATESPLQFEYIKVQASDSSIVTFHGNTQVNNLEVQLSKSSIEYGDGNLGQLSIMTDSVSRISLQTKHLLKAKITTIDNH
jgi:hypothetical protein